MVEFSKSSATVVDAGVQQELNQTGDVVKAKEATIKALQKLIAELKNEHETIQKVAARFSVYLKRNSITHYNDATEEYLEYLIKDEKAKLRSGASRIRLETLEKDLDRYKKFVLTMENGKSRTVDTQPLDEQGVANLIQTLYRLPHYGTMLKDLASVVGRAYEANFRERPYRISHKRYWSDDDVVRGQSDSMWSRITEAAQNSPWSRVTKPSRREPQHSSWSMVEAAEAAPKASRSVSGPSSMGSTGNYGGPSVPRTGQSMGYPSSSSAGSSHWADTPAKSNNPFHSSSSPPTRQTKHSAGDNDFWPDTGEKSAPPPQVKSIADWDEKPPVTNRHSSAPPMRGNSYLDSQSTGGSYSPSLDSHQTNGSFGSAAPPPYSGYSGGGPVGGPVGGDFSGMQPNGMQLVQKKGLFLRLKSKMKKQ